MTSLNVSVYRLASEAGYKDGEGKLGGCGYEGLLWQDSQLYFSFWRGVGVVKKSVGGRPSPVISVSQQARLQGNQPQQQERAIFPDLPGKERKRDG